MMTPTYVYCVVSNGSAGAWETGGGGTGGSGTGVGGGGVYVVRHENIAALVSPLASERLVIRPTRTQLFAHEHVVWAASREGAVIPVAFGTVFRSEADVVATLAVMRGAVTDALDAIGDRVELGLRVVRATANGGAIPESSSALSPEPSAADIARAVRDAVAHRLAVLVVPLPVVGERTLLRAALLVRRADVAEVAARLHGVAEAFAAAVRVEVAGPWAPYHFVRLGLRVHPDASAPRAPTA